MASILLAGSGRAVAATAFLALLSLIGFALLPSLARPRRVRVLMPLSLAAGALAVSWGVWLVGATIGTALTPLVPAILAFWSLRHVRAWGAGWRRVVRELAGLVRRAPTAAALVAIPLLLVLPSLFAPLADSDGVRYHVAFAKLFLLTGRVFLYRWDVAGAYSEGMEMLVMLLLPVTGGEGAKWLHAGFFVATLAAVVLLVHRSRRTRGTALTAAFLLAVTPVVLVTVPTGFVDQAGLFAVAVAALLVLRGAPPAAVGVACAAALMVKLTFAPAVLALTLLAFARLPRGARGRGGAVLVLPALVALAPLAIRNVSTTGDPFFPVGLGLLGRPIPGVSEASRRLVSQYNAGPGAVLGMRFGFHEGSVKPDEIAGVHHLLGLFACVLAFRARRLRPLLLLVVPYLLLAIPYKPPMRYLLPAWMALAVFEAEAIALLPRRLAMPMALLVASPVLVHDGTLLLGSAPMRSYLAGRLDRAGYLASQVPGWRAAELVNRLPAGGRVMALDFPGPYFFDRPWVAEGILNDPPLRVWLRSGATGDELLRRLQALDVRYLVVTPGFGGGTVSSLYPLAFSSTSARALVALRSRLRLVGRVDNVDVWAVPEASDS